MKKIILSVTLAGIGMMFAGKDMAQPPSPPPQVPSFTDANATLVTSVPDNLPPFQGTNIQFITSVSYMVTPQTPCVSGTVIVVSINGMAMPTANSGYTVSIIGPGATSNIDNSDTVAGQPAGGGEVSVRLINSNDGVAVTPAATWQVTIPYSDDTCSPALPITGLHLTAQPQGNTVALSWGTLTEINSKTFTVQRSADNGKTWVTVATQPTQATNGNSSTPLTYTAQDIVLQSGSYEYRVVETDINGSTTASNTVMVSITASGLPVYPNPAKDYINVMLPAGASSATYRLISEDGKIVLSGIMNNAGNHGTIQVAGIASGVYFLQVTVNNTTQTYEVQIQQ